MEAQKSITPQRPFSYAYLATDPTRGPHLISRTKGDYFATEMREGMKKLKMKNEDIEEILEDVGDDIKQAYIKLLQVEFKERIQNDPDFDEVKHHCIKEFLDKDKLK